MRSTPAALITTLLTMVVLFALAGFQVTGQTAGTRLLGRVAASIVELDRWLPAHRDNLRLLSRDRPAAPLELPGLPVQVSIPSASIGEADDQTLELAIERAMGEKLYNGGSKAVVDEDGVSHLSVTEPVRWTIDLLGDGAHGFWRFVLVLSVLFLVALFAGMLWTRQSPLMPVAAGGALAAALSLAAWLAAVLLHSVMDSAIDREIALALRDGAWIGLRNGLAVVAIALSALYMISALFRRPPESWQDEEWPETYEMAGHDSRRDSPPPY